jgi:hypothetical protein
MLEAERVGGLWEFSLSLCGLRKKNVGDDRDEIVIVLRDDVIYWVEKHIDLPETVPDNAPSVHLKFERDDKSGEIMSGSFVSDKNLQRLRKFKDY